MAQLAQDDSTLCSARDLLHEARSIIDCEVSRLEENIRALKSRRNELSPISRLPVEILCNIFKFSLINESRKRRPESWTNFSQVSQHWRSTALSAPELWADIPLHYPRLAQEMLKRSKMAKLTIRFNPLHERSGPEIVLVERVRSYLCEMNRIEKIIFTAIPRWIWQEIFRNLSNSAPQLHTLCIRTFSSRTAFSIHEDFLYDTERLRHVELINCKISWDSRLLTGLTCLTLEDSLKANSSIIQVLQALERMPALTDLHLQDSIPDDSEGPVTYTIVDLPCLRVLNISAGVGALTAVLRYITFPHTAVLNLTCKEDQSTQIVVSDFLSVLATKFLSTLVIRSLGLRVSNDVYIKSLNFYLWTTALQDCIPFSQISRSQLQLVLEWTPLQHHSYVDVLTCAFFDAMSLSFVTHLQISTSNFIGSQTWVKTFGKLPQIERVCVQDFEPQPFFEALVYKTTAAGKLNTTHGDVFFPKLRYIHLVGSDFEYISVFSLLDCLMERRERNTEVQVLRLDDCYYITSDEVKRLKEVVVDVIWNGIT